MRLQSTLLMLLFFAGPTFGQNGVRPPQGLSLGLAAGGSAFTAFHRTPDAGRLSAHTSGVFTGNVAFWPSKNWGLRVQVNHAPSRFEQIGPEPQLVADTARLAGLSIWSYQGQVNFRMPTIKSRIMPYGIVGGGVVKYSAERDQDPIPPAAMSDFSAGSRTVPSGVLGVGARVQTRRNGWALNFELVDQLSRTPISGTDGSQVKVTNAASFTVGLSWTLYSH